MRANSNWPMKMENGSVWNRIPSAFDYGIHTRKREILQCEAMKWKRDFHKAQETLWTRCFALVHSLCDLPMIPWNRYHKSSQETVASNFNMRLIPVVSANTSKAMNIPYHVESIVSHNATGRETERRREIEKSKNAKPKKNSYLREYKFKERIRRRRRKEEKKSKANSFFFLHWKEENK